MVTERQENLYKSLCEELGQEPEDDFTEKSSAEGSKIISELIAMRKEQKDKFEGKDDGCYYY